jgi:hypothetical protein
MKRGLPGFLGSILVILVTTGCGGGRQAAAHGGTPQAVAPEPTPDTTPVEALRTPAGIALKPEQPSATPAATATR